MARIWWDDMSFQHTLSYGDIVRRWHHLIPSLLWPVLLPTDRFVDSGAPLDEAHSTNFGIALEVRNDAGAGVAAEVVADYKYARMMREWRR